MYKLAGRKKKSKVPIYISKIQRAGNANKVLNITYTDKKGKVTNRFVEPYKLVGDDFWAFSIDKDQIRRFKVPQIGKVNITNKKFSPRWPIEIEGVESMNKVAMYKEEIMEKAAARAWKKHLGELSDSSRQWLENTSLLNYDKEFSGLERGTNNIIKKKKIKVTNISNEKKMAKHINKIMKGTSMESISKQFSGIKANQLAYGGYASGHVNPKGKAFLNKFNPQKPGGFSSAMDPADAKHNKWLEALLNRHEIDEIRTAQNAMKNKKKYVNLPNSEKGIITSVTGGHNSPKVIFSESANVAVAPKSIRDAMATIRRKSGEVGAYSMSGLEYGKSGVINKRLGNAMEKQIVKQNKPIMKQQADSIINAAKKSNIKNKIMAGVKKIKRFI